MNKKGLSLLEILVAGLILTLTLAGLLNIFVAGRRWVLHNRLRMTGGELGKYFLDPLQMDVRQDEWNNRCLGGGLNCPAAQTIDGVEYAPTYTRNLNTPIPNINRVRVDISYTE
jgi:Tfp pilus assembly protein PilW